MWFIIIKCILTWFRPGLEWNEPTSKYFPCLSMTGHKTFQFLTKYIKMLISSVIRLKKVSHITEHKIVKLFIAYDVHWQSWFSILINFLVLWNHYSWRFGIKKIILALLQEMNRYSLLRGKYKPLMLENNSCLASVKNNCKHELKNKLLWHYCYIFISEILPNINNTIVYKISTQFNKN